MSLLTTPSPRWFTIAAQRPFLTDLARGLIDALGLDALSEATILLPNRRAARALSEALLVASGRLAILPPAMRPLGDLEAGEPPFEPGELALDLPPAISPARRRFELAGLIAPHLCQLGREASAVSALDLADALAAFLDACQIEEAALDLDVAALVEGDLARHWSLTAEVLDIALTAWPARLAELGLMDLTQRRVALIRALARRWRERPPQGVLIAAGSTGSTKATADLLGAIAAAPRGMVVLPGLDQLLADKAWAEVGDQHPQGALRRLLVQAGIARGDVRPWPGSAEAIDSSPWRRRLISEALTPADRTADWLEVIEAIRAPKAPRGDPIAAGLAGLSLVPAAGEDAAATLAALILRQALEVPGRTAALVTPDAAMARRVQAQLSRWAVSADSSVGLPLAASGAGVLASLIARATAEGFDPVTLLAIAKHPLTRLRPDGREAFERRLRGPSPGDFATLKARLSGPGLWLAERLEQALAIAAAPFNAGPASAADAARALAQCLEALAREGEGRREPSLPPLGGGPAKPGGGSEAWAGAAGEGVAGVIASLLNETAALPPLTAKGFADLLAGLLERETVREGAASHPRLKILGVLEARLTSADVTILAGLEEGVWPQAAPLDPFLSRPLRERLGLPSPERRIGLSAHDFAQGACAPEVVLLTTARRGGAPTVESRWLWRLRTLVRGAGLELPGRPDILALARALDAPLADPPPALRTARRPSPTPPTAVRPRELPVTDIEKWVRDPYAIYARRILKLRRLDPPGAPIEARARGIAIHRAFERLAGIELDALDETVIEDQILQALREEGLPRAAMARETALAASLACWTLAFERVRRDGARLHVEQQGRMVIPAAGGDFTLTARADRFEEREGGVDILDFKTGRIPKRAQVVAGFSPQLTLTGAIVMAGGFACLGQAEPRQLLYVRLRGGRRAGDEPPMEPGSALAAQALAGLERRIEAFDDPGAGYLARRAPERVDDVGDYDLLARTWEWLVIGDAEEAE
ncbi:MAG TPA: double-strand break repair protein AddB [Caulobacteraceae bacterium]|nr:double-strand break repair protein AddB [Caulobacteraceae bacterium]